jgi:hypothetical protein
MSCMTSADDEPPHHGSRTLTGARGLYLVVAGPDGTGKTTVVEGLVREVLAGPVQLLHHRPHVLGGRTTDRGPVTEPHLTAPYPRWLSTSKLVFLFLDHLVGWLVKVRPWLRRGGDVVLERGWWDLAVDPLRYRLQPSPRLVNLLGRLLPRPDLTVVLGGNATVIADRKGELSPAETTRQLDAWASVVRSSRRTILVDATDPEDRVLARIRDATRGRERGQRWVALPKPTAPRWYLPSSPARASVTALQLYQPVTTRGRLGWEAARVVAAFGGFRLLARGQATPPPEVLEVLAPHTPPGTRIAVARGNHVGRNTALLLDGHSGRALAFAKIARDADGASVLAAEAAIGEHLRAFLPADLHAPALLHANPGLLVFEAVIGQPRSRPWWLPPDVAFMLGRLHRAGGRTDGLGPAHGDCAPWNLLRTERGWFLVDWAEGRTDAPPFEDVFHYLVQAHALLGRPRRQEAMAAFAGRGRSGAIVRAYAAGADLAFEDALALAPSYLERSSVGLDTGQPDGRKGSLARKALLRDLRDTVRP